MARKNTPSSYACGSCGLHGHNARTCPKKSGDSKSATQIMKEMRAAKRAARLARKPMQKATPIEEVVVESTISVSEPQTEQIEIVEETPVVPAVVSEPEFMGMEIAPSSTDSDIDPFLLSVLNSLGIDTSSITG